MIPGKKTNISSTLNSSGRCRNEPGRDSEYAPRMLTPALISVPTTVTPVLTITARLTTVSEKICRYASNVIPSGTSTSPPARVTVAEELRLVSTIV
ncbi:hypothetical protein ACFQ0B_03550 [Nonomuraea thailandensis]